MRALVAVGICAGLRVGELLGLRWRDVDLAGGRITVRASKTDAGQRVIDIWPELREELFAWKSQARFVGREDYVFPTSTGKPDSRSSVGRALRRAVERANESWGRRYHPFPR